MQSQLEEGLPGEPSPASRREQIRPSTKRGLGPGLFDPHSANTLRRARQRVEVDATSESNVVFAAIFIYASLSFSEVDVLTSRIATLEDELAAARVRQHKDRLIQTLTRNEPKEAQPT